jgi:predicted small lipoprotein YifL
VRLSEISRVRTRVMRLAMVFALAACGSKPGGGPPPDGDPTSDAHDGQPTSDSAIDAPPAIPDAAGPDAFVFPSKLDLQINCRNDCVLIANPASIAVPAGTEFTVNWINTGDTDCDVAKIDQFNQVPIIIGLEPGTSYHDSIREWCGAFTGTFNFRVSICTIHSYIPVNCGA